MGSLFDCPATLDLLTKAGMAAAAGMLVVLLALILSRRG